MSKRTTIMLEDEVDKKLRLLQAEEIKKKAKSVSYSKVLNAVLKKGLK